MKPVKIPVPIVLIALLLAAGSLACAQNPPEQDGEAEVGAEPAVSSAYHPADTGPRPAETSAADWKTQLKVKMALLDKLGIDSLHVEVTAREGVVGLSGTVEKRETRELAETVAESVPAVTSVRNDILLEASEDNPSKAGVAAGEAEAELKDAMLSTRVRLALVDGLGSDGFRIGTEVANGIVTLDLGPELTAARREEAIQVAKGVEGVAKVVSVG